MFSTYVQLASQEKAVIAVDDHYRKISFLWFSQDHNIRMISLTRSSHIVVWVSMPSGLGFWVLGYLFSFLLLPLDDSLESYFCHLSCILSSCHLFFISSSFPHTSH
ncbi:hypothetical protein CEXT_138181 [Caerostris extrusa]|uniref:Uncharacterized protein n=1 Tax=Caerostris extrusa TaxID=172846 RepID=A0AAV4QTS3_CAEEX|nr:hypothetical protein CEXT_138181 [Caerostris extrusa]